jgi:hypothetical protein
LCTGGKERTTKTQKIKDRMSSIKGTIREFYGQQSENLTT